MAQPEAAGEARAWAAMLLLQPLPDRCSPARLQAARCARPDAKRFEEQSAAPEATR